MSYPLSVQQHHKLLSTPFFLKLYLHIHPFHFYCRLKVTLPPRQIKPDFTLIFKEELDKIISKTRDFTTFNDNSDRSNFVYNKFKPLKRFRTKYATNAINDAPAPIVLPLRPPDISSTGELLPRSTRTPLAELRSGCSPF